MARALVTGLFLTQAINPVYAGLFDFKLGSGDKKEAGQPSGSAGTDGAQGEAKELEKCDKPYGTLAVVEPQDAVISHLLQYGLQSPTGLIRMMVQQSNCFQITSVGNSRLNDRMTAITRQQRSGEFRVGSRQGPGQRVAADYYLEPTILFAGETTSGDSLVGGLGGQGGIFGNLAVGVARAALR
ncbi:MAG: hypothetical protein B7Z49_01815, partial [Hydrogenophilales bacterium 12-63-5]